MANFVTKKDGTRVPFNQDKLKDSIAAAGTDAGLPNAEASDIAAQVSALVSQTLEGQEEISSTEIKEKVLAELEVSHPALAEAWKKYEETKGI